MRTSWPLCKPLKDYYYSNSVHLCVSSWFRRTQLHQIEAFSAETLDLSRTATKHIQIHRSLKHQGTYLRAIAIVHSEITTHLHSHQAWAFLGCTGRKREDVGVNGRSTKLAGKLTKLIAIDC